MKKIWLVVFFLFPLAGTKAQIPIAQIIKAAITKAIVAVDLKIQRLQTKTIWLQNAQKVLENDMSRLKLEQIGNWVQKQKDLYQNYFNELWKVKEVITGYHRVREIVDQEAALVRQYRVAWKGVQQDGHFTARELDYIGRVYAGILSQSLANVNRLALVVQSFTTQMPDASRLDIINRTADAMQKNFDDLRQFNSENIRVSLERSRGLKEIETVKQLYGLP